MESLTRRKLITQVSVGAGAAGVLAVAAACTSSVDTTSNPIPIGNPVITTEDPLAVFVTDPTKGTLRVMKGDREITVDNPSLAQSLLALA